MFGYLGALTTAYFIFGFAVRWWNEGDPFISRFEVNPAWVMLFLVINWVTALLPFLAVRRIIGADSRKSLWKCLICGVTVALLTLPINAYFGHLAGYLDFERMGPLPSYAQELPVAVVNFAAFFALAGLFGGAAYWWIENSFPSGRFDTLLGRVAGQRGRTFLLVMQAAGVLTAVVTGVFLGPRWWRPHVAWSLAASNANIPEFSIEQEMCGSRGQMLMPTWSPDGSRLASSNGMTLGIWDPAGASHKDIPVHSTGLVSPVFVANGQQVALPVDGNGFASFDVVTGEGVHKEPSPHHAGSPISYPLATPHSLAASPDGSLLAVAFGEQAIWLYETGDWKVLRTINTVPNGPMDWPRELTFSPDGKHLAFEQGNGIVIVDVEDGSFERWLAHAKDLFLHNIAFNPDGSMAAASNNESVYVFRLSDGATIASKNMKAQAHPKGLNWDPQGNTVVFLDDQSILHLWNPFQIGNNEKTIQLRYWASGAVFSADGTRLAATNGSCISIFHVTRQTGRDVLTMSR